MAESYAALTSLKEYVYLGKSGLKVSPLCLGTMTFGDNWEVGTNKDESKKIFDLYRSKGGNFYDTANIYTNGNSERYLGEFLNTFRSDAVVATKYSVNPQVFNKDRKETDLVSPNLGGNSRKNLVESLDLSLKRLNMNYTDILYIHVWDQQTPTEEVVRACDDIIRSGKALYVGISDVPSWVVAKSNTIAELKGFSPYIVLQTRYSLIDRSMESDLGTMLQEYEMSSCVWGALAEGFLTGKHKKGEKLEASGRNESAAMHLSKEKNTRILEEVQKIAQEVGKSAAQVSLNWTAQRPNVIPIIGAKSAAQLEDNLGCLDFTLNADQMKRLNTVSAPEHNFPFTFYSR